MTKKVTPHHRKKTTWKHSPIYQWTACKNNGLLGKIKRWLKIINDTSWKRHNNQRIWKPAVVTFLEKVHFIGSVKCVPLALQQKARKGRPDPEIMLVFCSYILSAQSPSLGKQGMIFWTDLIFSCAWPEISEHLTWQSERMGSLIFTHKH